LITEPSYDRAADVRAALGLTYLTLGLTYLTLGWMTVEGAAALWLGAASKSLLLEGFGLDSVVELFSAGVLLWRLRVEAGGRASAVRVEAVERRAARLVGYTLYGLALFVAANSLLGLTVLKTRTDTHESVWGILIGLAVTRLLPRLWWLDSVAALALIPLLLKEGREAVTGECGCCAGGNDDAR
jgi:hypothetical protein